MQAGEVYIDINARLDKFDAAMASVAERVAAQATKATAAFSGTFGPSLAEAAGDAVVDLKDEINSEMTPAVKEAAQNAGEEAGRSFSQGFENTSAVIAPQMQQTMSRTAVSSGRAFGDTFFGAIQRSWSTGGAERLGGVLAKQLGPMAAGKAADAMAGFIRSDKNIGEALNDALLSIPFAGSFINLGNALSEAIFFGAEKAAKKSIQIAESARNSILQMTSARQAESTQSDQTRADLMIQGKMLDIDMKRAELRAQGMSAGSMAWNEKQLDIEKETLEYQLKRATLGTEAEKKALDEVHKKKINLIQMERKLINDQMSDDIKRRKEESDRIKETDALRKKSAADAADEAADLSELELEYTRVASRGDEEATRKALLLLRQQQLEIQRQKQLKSAQTEQEVKDINRKFDAEKEILNLEDQQAGKRQEKKMNDAMERAQLGAENASTALGQFTFDPYPATRQREVQERTMKAVEKSATASGSQGFQ